MAVAALRYVGWLLFSVVQTRFANFFTDATFCRSFEHRMIDCCSPRKRGSASCAGTTRRRTESSIGNVESPNQSLFRLSCLEPNGGWNVQGYHHGNTRNSCRSAAGVRPRRGRSISERGFEIRSLEPGRFCISGSDGSTGATTRHRDHGILLVFETPFVRARLSLNRPVRQPVEVFIAAQPPASASRLVRYARRRVVADWRWSPMCAPSPKRRARIHRSLLWPSLGGYAGRTGR